MGNRSSKSYPEWWNTSKSDFKELKRMHSKSDKRWNEIVQAYRKDFAKRYRLYHQTFANGAPYEENHALMARTAKVYPDSGFLYGLRCLKRYGAMDIYDAQEKSLPHAVWVGMACESTLTREQTKYWFTFTLNHNGKGLKMPKHHCLRTLMAKLHQHRDVRDAAFVAKHSCYMHLPELLEWHELCQKQDPDQANAIYDAIRQKDSSLWTLDEILSDIENVPVNIFYHWYRQYRDDPEVAPDLFEAMRANKRLSNVLYPKDVRHWVETSGEPFRQSILKRYRKHYYGASNAQKALLLAQKYGVSDNNLGSDWQPRIDTGQTKKLPVHSLRYWWTVSGDAEFAELIVQHQPKIVLELALENPHSVFIEYLCENQAKRYADICEQRWLETAQPVWLYLCLTNGIIPDGAREYFEPFTPDESDDAAWNRIYDWYPDVTVAFFVGFVDCDENNFQRICNVLMRETNYDQNARVARAMISNCVTDPRDYRLLYDLIVAHPNKTQLLDVLVNWQPSAPPVYEE